MKLFIVVTVPQTFQQIMRDLPCYISKQFDVVVVSSDNEGLSSYAQSYGLKYYAIPMKRQISPFFDLLSIFALVRLIIREQPELIHSYTPKAGLVSAIAGFLCGVPYRVHTFTGLIFPYSSGFKKLVLRSVDSLICKLVSVPNPEGRGVEQCLKEVTSKKMKIIGNGNIVGVDLEHFSRENTCSDQVRKIKSNFNLDCFFTFIFVGRVSRDKGLTELIDSTLQLASEGMKIKLLVVGGYDVNDMLGENYIKKLTSSQSISYVGEVVDVRPYLAASSALVLPSYREGFPNVVLQAGAMCLPSLVSNVCGSNEIIEHGVNGIIFEPRSTVALSDAMRSFVSNRDCEQMGISARKNVEMKYSQELLRSELIKFYRGLADEKVC